MMWIFGIVIVLLLGAVGVVAAGRGGEMSEAYGDQPNVVLPVGRLIGAEDLAAVRFSVTWRGYRPSEVDALLARLATELPAATVSED